jgi:hypothetical protein
VYVEEGSKAGGEHVLPAKHGLTTPRDGQDLLTDSCKRTG